MGLLKGIKGTNKIEQTVEDDRLGGQQLFNSGVYLATIKGAYLDKSSGGSLGAFLSFEIDGKQLRYTQYLTNKQGENFYTKDGKNYMMMGYLAIDALMQLVAECPLEDAVTEDKIVKIWDNDLKKEVPQTREVFVDLLDKQVKIAVLRQIVDVTKKGDDGKYHPNGETKEENECVKFFHAETDQTLKEAMDGIEGGVFMQSWIEKFKDQIPNKAKGVQGGTTGSKPAPTGGERKPSLFNKK